MKWSPMKEKESEGSSSRYFSFSCSRIFLSAGTSDAFAACIVATSSSTLGIFLS